VITPSIGIEQPGCVAWEPAFGRDFEWTFLHALSQLGRPDGSSAYFRLSTRPVEQELAGDPAREDVLAGGYRLREGSRLTIAAMGAVVPEALAAADELDASVVCITSADLLFRALQARAGLGEGDPAILATLFPAPEPIVTLLDGHPHTLSFLAAVHGVPIACLGVQRFGQSGDIGELYEHHQIDAESVIGAALDLLG
jgi:pyruvate dehydrogenase E1 component